MAKKKKQPEPPEPSHKYWPLQLHHRGSQLVISVVLIALILIAASGRHHEQKQASLAGNNQTQISILNTGFSPVSLSIKMGTQVSWSNNDTRAHQVIIDSNPADGSVLGFDNNLVLRTGDSYSFTFIHPGTYTYHDQLNPDIPHGTITVN